MKILKYFLLFFLITANAYGESYCLNLANRLFVGEVDGDIYEIEFESEYYNPCIGTAFLTWKSTTLVNGIVYYRDQLLIYHYEMDSVARVCFLSQGADRITLVVQRNSVWVMPDDLFILIGNGLDTQNR